MIALLPCLIFLQLALPVVLCLSAPPITPIVACKSTAEVRGAIDAYIRPGDHVLELGAQLSDTSAHLCRAVGPRGGAALADVRRKGATSGRSIGRDTTPFLGNSSQTMSVESFQDRVEYHELDRFDEWRGLMVGQRQYDAMVLDVGATIGNDLYLSALSIANEFIAEQCPPRVVIVKSKVLNNLARRMIHSQRLLDGTVRLPTKDELVCRPDPLVIPCVGVSDYRRTIPLVMERGDDVIEVGCHYGTTTSMLHDAAVIVAKDGQRGGFCAGVDIGERIIKSAVGRYPHVAFEVADAWNTLDLLRLKTRHRHRPGAESSALGYDVVYADIGGLSGAHGLLESLALLDSLGRALEPRCIVIKSMCMKRLASQLIPFSKVKKRQSKVA